eukprot:12889715-Prorocentrum_lima.AAC.1
MTRKLSAMNPLAWQGRPPQVIQISRLENLGMGTGHETVLLSYAVLQFFRGLYLGQYIRYLQ